MNTNSLEINRVVFDTSELEKPDQTSVTFNIVTDISIIDDKDDAKTGQSVTEFKARGHLDVVENKISVNDLPDEQYDIVDEEWYKLDMKKAHNQYCEWRLRFLAGDSTNGDDQAEDQTYDIRKFELEAACPPGSPAERLRSCGLKITSYLLGAPSQIFTKSNCKIIKKGYGCTKTNEADIISPIDNKRSQPLMGTKVLENPKQQHGQESTHDPQVDVCQKLQTEFYLCPRGSKVEKLVQWG